VEPIRKPVKRSFSAYALWFTSTFQASSLSLTNPNTAIPTTLPLPLTSSCSLCIFLPNSFTTSGACASKTGPAALMISIKVAVTEKMRRIDHARDYV
jgi:hypothetical protein